MNQSILSGITNTIISIAGGIVGGLFTALVVWKIKRRTEKADDFTDVILPILRQIEEAKTPAEIIEIYKSTRPMIRDAAAKFSKHIKCRNRRAFNTAWREYCGIENGGFELSYGNFKYPEDLPKILFPPDNLPAKSEIFRLLNVMISLSS